MVHVMCDTPILVYYYAVQNMYMCINMYYRLSMLSGDSHDDELQLRLIVCYLFNRAYSEEPTVHKRCDFHALWTSNLLVIL